MEKVKRGKRGFLYGEKDAFLCGENCKEDSVLKGEREKRDKLIRLAAGKNIRGN